MTKAASAPAKWVLIIEDDQFISHAYTVKFKHEGIDNKPALDGEQGLELLKKKDKPSVILLDLMLPKISGYEVLEAIKKNPETSNIPVLILTNLSQASDSERCLALGANEYLVKADLKIETIIKKVQYYLALSK